MIDKSDKHAYLLMAHNNLDQLNFLIQNLDSEFNDIFLHIDAKSSIKKEEIVKPIFSHLYFCDPINVYWAEYSQVQCELSLLRLATRTGRYHYYHLISGMDFPLKSQREIHALLADRNDLFIHFTTPENVDATLSFVKYYHLFQKQLSIVNRDHTFSIYKVFNKALLLVQKIFHINRIPFNLTIKKGANWFSIPDDFARYVIDMQPVIERQFANTRSPDEFFMQTLAFNNVGFKKRIYRFYEDDSPKSCLRYIDWQRGTPYVFTVNDFDELVCCDMFFARKFDYRKDKFILLKLANFIGNTM
ncbi:hypothetical protein JS528_07350 [Bifidobacterium sp. MA2]|uniref:Peptide O-xylosyltransferase n=1 Tax=Bifidobacterium santillanense TaxID=2809028 RepID=A0ABS5UQQ5_9BIFI|nr:beta-1,6-N-acetylglucosaminyltransferase [Bifidobacterium santillanense]MBT1173168.1 hypothetical protein [Bifidobacterium santillanense]